MSTATAVRFFTAKGKVQKVMFRQTIIRGAQKRSLRGGATNHKEDKNRVDITLSGDNAAIDEMISVLRSGKEINNWGATATEVTENDTGAQIEQHKVTTENVDTFNWGKAEFYL